MKQYEFEFPHEEKNAAILLSLANSYLKVCEYDDALYFYKRLYDAEPTNSDYVTNLGIINYEMKNYPESEKFYLRSLSIEPNDRALYHYGILLHKQKKFEQAKKIFEKLNKFPVYDS